MATFNHHKLIASGNQPLPPPSRSRRRSNFAFKPQKKWGFSGSSFSSDTSFSTEGMGSKTSPLKTKQEPEVNPLPKLDKKIAEEMLRQLLGGKVGTYVTYEDQGKPYVSVLSKITKKKGPIITTKKWDRSPLPSGTYKIPLENAFKDRMYVCLNHNSDSLPGAELETLPLYTLSGLTQKEYLTLLKHIDLQPVNQENKTIAHTTRAINLVKKATKKNYKLVQFNRGDLKCLRDSLFKKAKEKGYEFLKPIAQKLVGQNQVQRNAWTTINSEIFKPLTGPCFATAKGKRYLNEDGHWHGTQIKYAQNTWALQEKNNAIDNNTIECYAVFDGHGGDKVSKMLQEKGLPTFVGWLNTNSKQPESLTETDFVEFFRYLDTALFKDCQNCGSTVNAVFNIGNESLFFVNIGDSQAIWKPSEGEITSTTAHSPKDNAEKNRIKKAGGTVSGSGRVKNSPGDYGGLKVARSLGDWAFMGKDPKTKQPIKLISNEAQVTKIAINDLEVVEGKRFAISVCDGVTDVFKPDEIYRKARYAFKQNPNNPTAVVLKIVQDTLVQSINDNVSAVIIPISKK